MASLHVNATTPAATVLESTPRNSALKDAPELLRTTPWFDDLFNGQGPVIKNGYAELPSRPGLGVTLNEEVAAQHPYKPNSRPEYRFADGSVADQ